MGTYTRSSYNGVEWCANFPSLPTSVWLECIAVLWMNYSGCLCWMKFRKRLSPAAVPVLV